MQVRITGKNHVEITPAIRDYATEKAGKLPRYFDGVSEVEVVADKPDRHFGIEIIAHVDGHKPFVGTSKHEDLYACIDQTIDKLERQLTDHKEKLRNH